MILIFMFAIWSSSFSIGKMALDVAPPLFLTASRMLVAGVMILGYLAWKNRSAFKITGKQFISIVLLALFSIYLTNAFEFWGLKHMSAAKTCFFYSLSPFFSAFFSYLHFGEKMNRWKWLGMAIGFLGFIPVLAAQKGSEELLSSLVFISWPELAVIAASMCSGYGWILLRLSLKDHSIPLLMLNGLSMLIGGVFALIHSFFIDPWTPIPVASADFQAFAQGFIIIIFISNILCYNLYGFLLKRFTATFMSFMGLLFPIFASINSRIFLNEPFSPTILFSTAIISVGLWLFYSAELRQGYVRKEISDTAKAASEP
ncbi:MAG TPA: DMT family transporter [Chlamydiales bacterium]|nr:DMT family transporter [Chlamydiales bacterium]